jgi:hypothetical protein
MKKMKREEMQIRKSITMKKVTVMRMSMSMSTTMNTSMIIIMMRTDAQVMEFSTLLNMLSTSTSSVNQRIKLAGEMEETGPKKTQGSIFSVSTKM